MPLIPKSTTINKVTFNEWDTMVDLVQDLVIGHIHDGIQSKKLPTASVPVSYARTFLLMGG